MVLEHTDTHTQYCFIYADFYFSPFYSAATVLVCCIHLHADCLSALHAHGYVNLTKPEQNIVGLSDIKTS